jgi:hypothetical protein
MISDVAVIAGLAALQSLALSKNQITDIGSIGLKGHTQLRGELYLSDNKLESLPADIGSLSELSICVLSRNSLTRLPAELGLMTSLERLMLDSNGLTSIPEQVGQLVRLKMLSFAHNQICVLSAAVGRLVALEELDLAFNRLEALADVFDGLTALTELGLAGNRLAAEVGGFMPPSLLKVYSTTPSPLLAHTHLGSLPPLIRCDGTMPPQSLPVLTSSAGVFVPKKCRLDVVDSAKQEERRNRLECEPILRWFTSWDSRNRCGSNPPSYQMTSCPRFLTAERAVLTAVSVSAPAKAARTARTRR